MRIVFMGTPDIARAALAALLADGHEVAAVYTRQDKPVGRKQLLTPPPVKVLAAENRIPVEQPASLRSPDAAAVLAGYRPDLVVVVAYGLLLPAEILEVPPHGCINLHVSLLPRYRGAAPIQWAVINGDAQSGVSIMQMDEGMDTGDVLAERAFEIGPNDTAGEVFETATVLGGRLLAETVQAIEKGGLAAVPQQGQATVAPRLDKGMAEMDFARPAQQLHNLVRGCNPWPLAWFGCGGKKVKVLRTQRQHAQGAAPGEVLGTKPLAISCGQGSLVLERVLPEGGREMTGEQWAAGRRFKAGDNILKI